MLTPGDEIRNLLGRYCEAIDRGDWIAVGELFARGALATEDGAELARGREAVADFYRGGTQLHDGSPRTKHIVTNTVLRFEGADMAVATSSYVVLQAIDGELALQPIIAGRYTDTFADVPSTGGWHFVERRFAVDLMGDLSHHLTWSL